MVTSKSQDELKEDSILTTDGEYLPDTHEISFKGLIKAQSSLKENRLEDIQRKKGSINYHLEEQKSNFIQQNSI